MGINKFIIQGFLIMQPLRIKTINSYSVKLKVCTKDSNTDQSGVIDILCDGKLADYALNHLVAGDYIFVEGFIKTVIDWTNKTTYSMIGKFIKKCNFKNTSLKLDDNFGNLQKHDQVKNVLNLQKIY